MIPSKLVSFGFRNGRPDAPRAAVIDVRPLIKSNPYNIPHLKPLAGDSPELLAWFDKLPEFTRAYGRLLLRLAASKHATVYLGCSGGRHRSVALAHVIGRQLGIPVEHRDKLLDRHCQLRLDI